jgi:tetratricopeptide (TPR) repeat protein
LCQAGAYDEAHQIRRERIYQDNRKVLTHQLGAYDTTLSIMQMFFPQGVLAGEPQVSQADDKSWILNTVGLCLMNLGRMGEAIPFYERVSEMDKEIQNWNNAGLTLQNIADLQSQLGKLPASAGAAQEALRLNQRAESKQNERNSLNWLAWTEYLQGEVTAAGEHFQQAEVLEREIDSRMQFLYGKRGTRHADHLRRTGQVAQAQAVTIANLDICERNRWAFLVSQCHRVLGDVAAGQRDHSNAHKHYQQAVALARTLSKRDVLIEALLGRGGQKTRSDRFARSVPVRSRRQRPRPGRPQRSTRLRHPGGLPHL